MYKIILVIIIFFYSCTKYTKNSDKLLGTNLPSNAIPDRAIPINLENNRIIIPVEINDTISSNLTFDSGLHESIIIDSLFARKYNLFKNVKLNKRIAIHQFDKAKPHAALFSFNNTSISIKLGIDTIFVRNFYILNLKKTFGCNSDMLVGSSFFNKKIFKISYKNSYLLFYNKINKNILYNYDTLNLINVNRSCYGINTKLKFNDTNIVKLIFMIDTGSPRYFLITNMNKTDINKIVNAIPADKTINVLDFVNRSRNMYDCIFLLNQKHMYPCIFEQPIATLSPHTDYNGIIGNAFLSEFEPIFNLVSNELYIRKNTPKDILHISKLGIELGFYFHIFNSKKVMITGVVKNSFAEKSGITPNDSIIAINNKNISSYSNLKEYLLDYPYNKEITFKLKRQDSTCIKTIKKKKFNNNINTLK